MTDRSKCLGSMVCPICGKIGQLKRRTDRKHLAYYQIDHWKKGNSHRSGYAGSCYIGLAEAQLTKTLSLLHKNPNIAKIEIYPLYSAQVLKRLGVRVP